MASVNMLSVDDLLIIFNFLTLFDKLAAMRVCTAWYNIIKGTHAWKVINFFDKGPAEGEQKDKINFPPDENKTCEFLETFAGVGLQEVYLSFVSDKVMTTLRTKCPNLETLSFHKAQSPHREPYSPNNLDYIPVEDIIYVPPKLRCLEMSSYAFANFSTSVTTRRELTGEDRQNIYDRRDDKIASLIGQCHDLRCISLTRFRLSEKVFQTMTASLRLKEIDIINPHAGCRKPRNSTCTLLDAVLTASAVSLLCLRRFRLDCYSHFKRHIYMLDRLPSCIAHWTNLRVLALRGVGCSDESFEMMIPSLLNLDSLELEGNIVTSGIISMVGKNLKKVTFLEVGNGHYSDESLESLASHPSLEKLWIYKESSNQRDIALTCKWLHTIYGVLTTLQKIKHVKMEGYRLIYLHSHETFPVIESAEVVIDNVDERRRTD